LRIPKLRAELVSPALLERHRRVDQALFAVGVAADGRREVLFVSTPGTVRMGLLGWLFTVIENART